MAAGEVHGLLGQEWFRQVDADKNPRRISRAGPRRNAADRRSGRALAAAAGWRSAVRRRVRSPASWPHPAGYRAGEPAAHPSFRAGGIARPWAIDWARERTAARGLFERYSLDIDPGVPVSRLSSVERALVAIVRAVEEIAAGGPAKSGNGVLVLDEPTPFLPRADVDRLFTLVRRVVAAGASVIFVSHDIDEVLEITDRATVLRDGQVAGVMVTANATRDAVVSMIVGRRLQPGAPRSVAVGQGPAAVTVEKLSGAQVTDISLSLRSGEIVGLTGLLGSGYEQVPYLLYGALQAQSGTLMLGTERIDLTTLTPAAAIKAGLVLIPGDRPVAGGVGALPIVDNLTLPALTSRFRPIPVAPRRHAGGQSLVGRTLRSCSEQAHVAACVVERREPAESHSGEVVATEPEADPVGRTHPGGGRGRPPDRLSSHP